MRIYISGTCLPDFICTTCMQMAVKVRRGSLIPWFGVTGSYESPDMGAGNQTHIFCKSNKHAYPLNSLLPSWDWLPTQKRFASRVLGLNIYIYLAPFELLLQILKAPYFTGCSFSKFHKSRDFLETLRQFKSCNWLRHITVFQTSLLWDSVTQGRNLKITSLSFHSTTSIASSSVRCAF